MTQTQTTQNLVHANRTAKVVELICSSTKSFEDAVVNGLRDAQSTTRDITGCEVENFTVKCNNGEIVEWRATIKVAFGIERKST